MNFKNDLSNSKKTIIKKALDGINSGNEKFTSSSDLIKTLSEQTGCLTGAITPDDGYLNIHFIDHDTGISYEAKVVMNSDGSYVYANHKIKQKNTNMYSFSR